MNLKYFKTVIILFLVICARCFFFYKDYVFDDYTYGEETGVVYGKVFKSIRTGAVSITRKVLPSPHSELILGMVIGLDEFGEVPIFKQMLKDTGTIHVVVVSGFNITLVFSLVQKFLGSKYKMKNMLMSQFVVLFYSLLSGFDPPVVRSLVMGSIAAWVSTMVGE